MAIRDAVERFLEPWQFRLGFKLGPDHPKEHWTRVKALSLRVNQGRDDYGYDTLRPVDDLRSRLQEGVSRWLDRQETSLDEDATAEERLAALTFIRQNVYGRLQDMALDRIALENHQSWVQAYGYSGPGSSYRRADEIGGLYRRAAPIIGFDQSSEAQTLINLVLQAIRTAAEQVDSRLD